MEITDVLSSLRHLVLQVRGDPKHHKPDIVNAIRGYPVPQENLALAKADARSDQEHFLREAIRGLQKALDAAKSLQQALAALPSGEPLFAELLTVDLPSTAPEEGDDRSSGGSGPF